MNKIDKILHYWFDHPNNETRDKLWWGKNPAADAHIKHTFGDDVTKVIAGDYDYWGNTANGRLALIILLDQMSRQIYRDDTRAFAQDPKALQLALQGIKLEQYQELEPIKRVFFYIPLEHSEDKQVQQYCVELYQALAEINPAFQIQLDFALRHKAIINQFGRFPHRNTILGRESTEHEVEFLQQSN